MSSRYVIYNTEAKAYLKHGQLCYTEVLVADLQKARVFTSKAAASQAMPHTWQYTEKPYRRAKPEYKICEIKLVLSE